MNITPANSLQRISFFTLAGVEKESVRLEAGHVVGQWAENPTPLHAADKRGLVEEFVNWRNTPEEILRFIRKYGPLEEPYQPGGAFRFPLRRWQGWQKIFRDTWEAMRPEEGATKVFGVAQSQRAAIHGWQLFDGRLAYRTANLWELLHLDLYCRSPERLRKCANPNCNTPYFVARHLRQNYCSEPCARLGQQQWKQRWWNERGREWRRDRRKKIRVKRSKRGQPRVR